MIGFATASVAIRSHRRARAELSSPQHDPSFKEIRNSNDALVPDGMPLIWLGRAKTPHLSRRVYSPDLLFVLMLNKPKTVCFHAFCKAFF